MNRQRLLAALAVSCAPALCPAGGLFAADLPAHAGQLEASTQQLPAVSARNFKLDLFGGGYENGALGGIEGALSIPLGIRFGTQIDGVGAAIDGEFFGSISDHLFWRDPSRGLLGLYGSYSHYNGFGGLDVYHGGVEAELYLGRVTLRGLVGYEVGDAGTENVGGTPVTYDFDNRMFDKLDVIYYPRDDLQLFVGQRYTGGILAGAAGAEYLWRSEGTTATSTFVEGRLGQDNSKAVWAGVRLYFGESGKSLIRRHREDDPNLWEPDNHLGIDTELSKTKPVAEPL